MQVGLAVTVLISVTQPLSNADGTGACAQCTQRNREGDMATTADSSDYATGEQPTLKATKLMCHIVGLSRYV